jgi:uncharacterized protein YcfL
MKRVILFFALGAFLLGGCASHKNVRHHKKKRKGGCDCSKWSYNHSEKTFRLQEIPIFNQEA